MSQFQPFQQLQQLLAQTGDGAGGPRRFPPNSRYVQTPIAQATLADGTVIVCLKRRFVPPPERFSLVRKYTVSEGDRLDNLAAQLVGDPEMFWQLCDANRALEPRELEQLGRVLRVTLPEGIPAPRSNT
jgi:hypothetical protein